MANGSSHLQPVGSTEPPQAASGGNSGGGGMSTDARLARLEVEITHLATKADLKELEATILRGVIKTIGGSMRTGFTIIGLIIGAVGLIIGAVGLIVKFL